MRVERFLRRREITLPTATGWAVFFIVLATVTSVIVRGLPPFLALDAPVGHGVLIVEGWMPRSGLSAAAAEFRRGGYDALVAAGGRVPDPVWEGGFATYAERAAAFLRTEDLGGRELIVVPGPPVERERTYEAALAVRRWLDATGRHVDAADVYSVGPHARRSRDLYQLALGRGVRVGCRAAPPSQYELGRWWRTSAGARDVLSEAIGYAWVLCCFSPKQGP
jgi:hypothetical protein